MNKQLFADRSFQVAYSQYDLPNIYFVLSLYFPNTSNFSFLHLTRNTVHHVIYWYHNVHCLCAGVCVLHCTILRICDQQIRQ